MTTQDESRTLRRTTKLEIGVLIVLLSQLIAIIWFAAGLQFAVQKLSDDMIDVKRQIANQSAQAPELAVLRYRVEQLERRLP